MKRKLIVILSIILMSISAMVLTVNAADAKVTLKSDKLEVKPGDTFTITVGASCEDGINGLTGSLNYNKDQLELVSAIVTDGNWSSLGQNSEGNVEIAIISNSSETKTADVFKVTFKVKDSIERGTTIKVTPTNITLDSFAETNSEHSNTGANEISVKVKETSSVPEGTTNSGTKPSIEQSKPINNITENEYQEITNKNATQSEAKIMPYTGTNIFVVIAVVAIGTISVVSYVSYKKYKNI